MLIVRQEVSSPNFKYKSPQSKSTRVLLLINVIYLDDVTRHSDSNRRLINSWLTIISWRWSIGSPIPKQTVTWVFLPEAVTVRSFTRFSCRCKPEHNFPKGAHTPTARRSSCSAQQQQHFRYPAPACGAAPSRCVDSLHANSLLTHLSFLSNVLTLKFAPV